jgi:hypothetical protein
MAMCMSLMRRVLERLYLLCRVYFFHSRDALAESMISGGLLECVD